MSAHVPGRTPAAQVADLCPPAPGLERSRITEALSAVALQYPRELVAGQLSDIPRIAFNIGLVAARSEPDARVCDLGGGIGLFSVGCAALGMQSTLVDDFNDGVNREFGEVPRLVHERYRVRVVSADVLGDSLEFPEHSFDAITSFDSMEHWHHSPKKLFAKVLSWLRPGGLLVLGVPNCVNLRKRLTVPFGIGKWSPMSEWYESERFRGHVREPDTGDLRYIGRDLGLTDVEIIGRNWLGYNSRHRWIRVLTPLVDAPLRAFPSLCADIYLVGTKPGAPRSV
jgi:SAM-dependent methyltransferase